MCTVVKTCSEVGGLGGKARPSALLWSLSSLSSSLRTVSSDSSVTEEERERAGVEAGERGRLRARASALLRAER